jgi:hypothetical protein
MGPGAPMKSDTNAPKRLGLGRFRRLYIETAGRFTQGAQQEGLPLPAPPGDHTEPPSNGPAPGPR